MKVTSYHQLCCTIKARSTRWIWKSYQHNKINHSCWWDLQFLHQYWLPFQWGDESRPPPPDCNQLLSDTKEQRRSSGQQQRLRKSFFRIKNSPFWLTGDLTLLLLIVTFHTWEPIDVNQSFISIAVFNKLLISQQGRMLHSNYSLQTDQRFKSS